MKPAPAAKPTDPKQTPPPIKPVDPTQPPAKPVDPAPPTKPAEKRLRVNMPVIEVLDPSGTMTAPFVRAAILKVEPELLRCAEASRWQSTALAWIVTDWRGKVTKLELAVDSASVEKCLAATLRSVVVQSSQVRATAFVKLVVGDSLE